MEWTQEEDDLLLAGSPLLARWKGEEAVEQRKKYLKTKAWLINNWLKKSFLRILVLLFPSGIYLFLAAALIKQAYLSLSNLINSRKPPTSKQIIN